MRLFALVCLVFLSLVPIAPAFAQGEVTFSASVDRSAIRTDEWVTLELTLTGTFKSAGKPEFPPLEGFAIVSSGQASQFSLINGKMSSQVVFTYRLEPTRVGTLTIPSISIEVGKQTYQTQPVTVEVTQGAAPPPGQPTVQAPGELAGQDLYVEASVNHAAPFVGQQIIYSFRLYQAVNLFNQPGLDWPDFTHFLTYDLSPNKQYNQSAAGRRYLVTEVRRALFPTTPGEVTLDPAVLTVPGDFFNRGFQMETAAVTVNVQPLSEGAPTGFSGAVGQFEMEAWVEPPETRVNEPVSLFVRVSGAGNLSMVSDPTAGEADALTGWRVYDAQVETEVSQEGDTIAGQKVFERLLVPAVEGDLTLPAFELAYFDPLTGEYRSLETAPLSVQVAPGEAQPPGPVIVGEGKQDVIVIGSDIRHIKTAPPSLVAEPVSLVTQSLYWAGWGVPLLAVVGTWLWDRRRRALRQDVAYARAQRARKLARKRLAQARRLVSTDKNAACAAVARALAHYLGDKFNLPSAGLTRDTIQQALAARSVPPDLAARLLACLDWADSGRFAPGSGGRDTEALVREAEDTIAELEEAIA